MARITLRQLLDHAAEHDYGVPAFNINNMEQALAIMDAGAYFVPFATSFSFPRPAIVMVDGSDVHLLRRAETFEDIIALDRVEQPPTNEKRQALQ